MLKCFYVFWWMILLDRFAKHHPKNRLSLIVVKQSFIANPAKSPSSWWNYSQCHDPPGFRVANILLSRWPTCKLLGITYLANKKSSMFFLSLAHMVHGLSEISTVIRLNQAWFNLSHLNHLWFGFRMVLLSSAPKNKLWGHDEFDDSELIFTKSRVLKRSGSGTNRLTMLALACFSRPGYRGTTPTCLLHVSDCFLHFLKIENLFQKKTD